MSTQNKTNETAAAAPEAPQTRTAYFERFTLEMPIEAIPDCSPAVARDEDVEYWSNQIQRSSEITTDALRKELKEYGAWDQDELSDDNANWRRLIWIAAGNLKEEM